MGVIAKFAQSRKRRVVCQDENVLVCWLLQIVSLWWAAETIKKPKWGDILKEGRIATNKRGM